MNASGTALQEKHTAEASALYAAMRTHQTMDGVCNASTMISSTRVALARLHLRSARNARCLKEKTRTVTIRKIANAARSGGSLEKRLFTPCPRFD